MMLALLVVLAAYLSGSVPYGYLIAKARRIDIQQQGSGNIGATNVARTLGKKTGVVVLVLDAAKGALPVALASWLVQTGQAWPFTVVASALAAVAGHCFPLWLRFHGGKGVATALGVFLVIDPPAAGLSVVVFAAVFALARVASLGSLVAAWLFPLFLHLRGRPWIDVALALVMALIILVRHKDNLSRLRKGEERGL